MIPFKQSAIHNLLFHSKDHMHFYQEISDPNNIIFCGVYNLFSIIPKLCFQNIEWEWVRGGGHFHITPQCLWDVTTRSNMSRGFMLVHIFMYTVRTIEKEMKPLEILEKMQFKWFLVQHRGILRHTKKKFPWNQYLISSYDRFINSSKWADASRYI